AARVSFRSRPRWSRHYATTWCDAATAPRKTSWRGSPEAARARRRPVRAPSCGCSGTDRDTRQGPLSWGHRFRAGWGHADANDVVGAEHAAGRFGPGNRDGCRGRQGLLEKTTACDPFHGVTLQVTSLPKYKHTLKMIPYCDSSVLRWEQRAAR